MLEYNDEIENFGYADDCLIIDNEFLKFCIDGNGNNFYEYDKDNNIMRCGSRKLDSDEHLIKWLTNGLRVKNGMKPKKI